MRKLVLVLIALIALATFLRAYQAPDAGHYELVREARVLP